MKPFLHSRSSVHKWGGEVEDYQPIHDFLDETKAHFADMRHRAMLHNSWGIYLCERIFGINITNSIGKLVSVRDIAERHIIEDLGRIPSIGDYLQHMTMPWWIGGRGHKKKQIDNNIAIEEMEMVD